MGKRESSSLVYLSALIALSAAQFQRESTFGDPNLGGSNEFNNANSGRQQESFSTNPFIPNTRDFNSFSNSRDPNPSFPVTPRTSFNSGVPQRAFGPQNQLPRQDFGDGFTSPEDKECLQGWDTFRQSCYRFVRSPIHTWDDAQKNCQVI